MPELSPSTTAAKHASLPQLGLNDLSVPHRSYRQLLIEGPRDVAFCPSLTSKQLRALQGSIKKAFSGEDLVRRLVVTVRAALLNKTVPQYAEIIGIKRNTLLRIEDKGFDPVRSLATSYHPFVADWRKRAQEQTPTAPFYRWAEHQLTKLLLRRDLGAPYGLLREWQLQVGSEEFTKRTGISSGLLWEYRATQKAFSLKELLDIGEKIHSPAASSDSCASAKEWDSSWVKRARQVYFHQSLKLKRSVSATRLHMAFAWAGINPTVSELARVFPGLSEDSRQRISRFEPIPPAAWQAIRGSEIFPQQIPPSELARIDQTMTQERHLHTRSLPSTRLAVRLMREQKLSTKTLAYLTGVHDDSRPRYGSETIRNLIFDGVAGQTVSWGALAAVLSRNQRELSQLLKLRADEWRDSYQRRTGQPLSPYSLYVKMWGEAPELQEDGAKPPKIDAGLHSKRTEAILRRALTIHTDPDPRVILNDLIQVVGPKRAIARLATSTPRLQSILQGEAVPPWNEYRGWLQAAGIFELPTHEVGWRELCGATLQNSTLTTYGKIQHRIIQTLVFDRFNNKSDFCCAGGVAPGPVLRLFRILEEQGELNANYFERLLSIGGLAPGDPRQKPIKSILTHKDFSTALVEWFNTGLQDVPSPQQALVTHLFSSCEQVSLDDLRPLTTPAHELLDYKYTSLKPKQGATSEENSPASNPLQSTQSSRRSSLFKLEVVKALSFVMHTFPGVTLKEISTAIQRVKASQLNANPETVILSTWVPRFETPSKRRLVEAGIHDASPKVTSHLPTSARDALDRFAEKVRPLLRDNRGPLQSLFSPPDTQPPFAAPELHNLLRSTLATLLPHTNLMPSEAKQLSDALEKIFSLSGSPERSVRLAGTLIGATITAPARHGFSTKLTTLQAIDRLFTFFLEPEDSSAK